jgi:hypothetical protein
MKQEKITPRQSQILEIINENDIISPGRVLTLLQRELQKPITKVTLNRDLTSLINAGMLMRHGRGRAVQYSPSSIAKVIAPINLDRYFAVTVDHRQIQDRFNFEIFEQLASTPIFSQTELDHLIKLDSEYKKQKSQLSPTLIKKEFERVTIELSWKSSAIEGNTYSLLETETLLKEGIEAKGKKTEEAIMLLNHKAALEFLRDHSDACYPLNVNYIGQIYSTLISNLGVSRNLRRTMVGVTGTRYRPLDNVFQIREALEKTCQLINSSLDSFSRSMISILLISYIQPFEDGNKRCSRIVGNALLLANDSFPLSFRSVDETEYKKAILLFYERSNISAFKKIFLEQAEFSVKNYFRSTL